MALSTKNAFRKSRLGLCQFLPSDWMIKKQRNISMRANVIKKKDIWPWLRVMLGTLYQIHREKAVIFSVFNWPTGVTLLSYLFDCHSKVSLQGDPYWSMICGKIRRSRLSKRIFLFWWFLAHSLSTPWYLVICLLTSYQTIIVGQMPLYDNHPWACGT